MFSYCCNVPVTLVLDTHLPFDRHVILDWYHCSNCYRACDKLNYQQRKVEHNE